MAADNDFNRLMDCLRRGDEDAASEVFHRFARRLIALARSQLDSWIRTRVEPEDVVLSVFRSFFTRFEAGQFQLGNWDNLWTVLTLITIRKSTRGEGEQRLPLPLWGRVGVGGRKRIDIAG